MGKTVRELLVADGCDLNELMVTADAAEHLDDSDTGWWGGNQVIGWTLKDVWFIDSYACNEYSELAVECLPRRSPDDCTFASKWTKELLLERKVKRLEEEKLKLQAELGAARANLTLGPTPEVTTDPEVVWAPQDKRYFRIRGGRIIAVWDANTKQWLAVGWNSALRPGVRP